MCEIIFNLIRNYFFQPLTTLAPLDGHHLLAAGVQVSSGVSKKIAENNIFSYKSAVNLSSKIRKKYRKPGLRF